MSRCNARRYISYADSTSVVLAVVRVELHFNHKMRERLNVQATSSKQISISTNVRSAIDILLHVDDRPCHHDGVLGRQERA
jgi:hypothetical protein